MKNMNLLRNADEFGQMSSLIVCMEWDAFVFFLSWRNPVVKSVTSPFSTTSHAIPGRSIGKVSDG
jgi:hypothetical protein